MSGAPKNGEATERMRDLACILLGVSTGGALVLAVLFLTGVCR